MFHYTNKTEFNKQEKNGDIFMKVYIQVHEFSSVLLVILHNHVVRQGYIVWSPSHICSLPVMFVHVLPLIFSCQFLTSQFSQCLWFSAAGPLEEERFGFPAFSGISRLTWLVSLFGELSVVSATLEERKEDQYMKMTVCLETENKR